MKINQALDEFELWKSYRSGSNTVKGYIQVLKQLCIFTHNKDLEQVSLQDVLNWFELHTLTGYDTNSLIPKAIALRKFFEFYKKRGFSVIDPWLIPVPAKEYKIPRVATYDQYKAILEAIPHNNDPRHIRNRVIIMLLWDTGARNGEITGLNMHDLKDKEALIKTEKNKGSRPFRQIFWEDETDKALKAWIETRERLKQKITFVDPEALFISISASGKMQKSGQRLSIKGVGEMLRRYSNRAKIPYINAHAFRHSFGHRIVKSGMHTADVSNLMGHASAQSSMVYTNMFGLELKERYDHFKKAEKVIHREPT